MVINNIINRAKNEMMNETTLEFNKIKDMLIENACTSGAKEKILNLTPYLSERECKANLDVTTQARIILDAMGAPPLSSMVEMEKLFAMLKIGGLLTPGELLAIAQFLVSSRRMKQYLERSDYLAQPLSTYRYSIIEIPELINEIERCIRGDLVDSHASKHLLDVRTKIEQWKGQIKGRLAGMLQKNKVWFSDSFVVSRNGRLVLPVRKEYKNKVQGAVVDMSASGSTYFIEPNAIGKLQEELGLLEIQEDNEVKRILYELSAMAQDALDSLLNNKAALEVLDFAFAKARLSLDMQAIAPIISMEKRLLIINGRHPLLPIESCVPLNISMDEAVYGVVITGPNTGGKTVALKTIGLLCMMAQCGLHIPAENKGERHSIIPMRSGILCDIGDGQSISENLSTFSAHMTNILNILKHTTHETLVLLDELGSGTDPMEGMGMAIAILEELRESKCLFVVTTHYPEVKEYAKNAPGLTNARMAFDRESLRPLYKLEIGEAGESCALYIAKRLGFSDRILKRAGQEAYRGRQQADKNISNINNIGAVPIEMREDNKPQKQKNTLIKEEAPKELPQGALKFKLGDSVLVYPGRQIGLVYAGSNDRGEIGVQIKGVKQRVLYKRLKLHVPAEQMYPEGYDFSIVFDSVENRKARHQLGKGHRPGFEVKYEKEDLV